MPRFCPKCGKSIEKGIFCEDCEPHIIDYKKSEIKICCICNKIFSQGSWKKVEDLREAVIKEITSKIKQKDIEISIEPLPEFKPGIKEECIAEVIQSKVTHDVPFVIEITYCPKCSKQGTQYFEAILQVRNINKSREKIINEELKKESVHGNVSNKTVKQPNGVDYYMTSRRAMPKLAQRIREKTGGIISLNPRLFSVNHQTGKEIYRLNVLLELPELDVGDVYLYRNKYILITNLSKQIGALNLLTKKNFFFTYKEFKYWKDKDSESIKKLQKQSSKLIKIYPSQEILHPDTYQSLKLLNPISEPELDKPLDVIIIDKGASALN